MILADSMKTETAVFDDKTAVEIARAKKVIYTF